MGSDNSKAKKSTPMDNDAHVRILVQKIIDEKKKKLDETAAAEVARDERMKKLVRDVMKETLASVPTTSSGQDTAAMNEMMKKLLREISTSRGNDPDNTTLLNILLDLQQQLRNNSKTSGAHADVAEFVKKQLESMQGGVKITVEKPESSSSSQQRAYDLFGPPVAARSAESPVQAQKLIYTPNLAQAQKPTFTQSPARAQIPTSTQTFGPLQAGIPPPNPGPGEISFRDRYQPARDLDGEHFQKESLQNNVPYKNIELFQATDFKANIPVRDPLHANKLFPDKDLLSNAKQFPSKQFSDKAEFKTNIPPNNNLFKEKEHFKNNKPDNDNGPFLDKGSIKFQGKGYGINQFTVNPPNQLLNNVDLQKPPPQLSGDFPQQRGRGGFPDNRGRGGFPDNRGRGGFPDNKGRGGFPDNRGRRPFLSQNPEQFENNGPNHFQGPIVGFNPDARRSQSPHQNRGEFHNKNEGRPHPRADQGNFQVSNQENYQNHPPYQKNQRGNFPHRGRGNQNRGSRNSPDSLLGLYLNQGPRAFPNHHQSPVSNHDPRGYQAFNQENFPGQGPDQQHFQGQHKDQRFDQNHQGNYRGRGRMPRRGRENNNFQQNPRSHSQPRFHHQNKSTNLEKCFDNLEKLDNREKFNNNQGSENPKGSFSGQGAFPKQKKQGGAKEKKNKQKGKQGAKSAALGAESTESQRNSEDSDLEGVKSDASTITRQRFTVKDGIYIALEDGTIFKTVEDMGDLASSTVSLPGIVVKKRRNKAKKNLKKSSSIGNITVSQDDAVDGSQSENEEPSIPSGGVRQEASTPLQLFIGAGFNNQVAEGVDPNEKLQESIMLVSKVEGTIKSCTPRTVGELLEFKKEHPNAEVIVVR